MTILLSLAILLAIVAIALCFVPWRWSAAPAMAAMLLAWFALPTPAGTTTLIMWSVTAILAMALNKILPEAVAKSRRGTGYIAGGALAGIFIGYLISRPWMVAGAALGAILGGVAYCFTPQGRGLRFPSPEFVQYLCAKGLPAVVTISMSAITVSEALNIILNTL